MKDWGTGSRFNSWVFVIKTQIRVKNPVHIIENIVPPADNEKDKRSLTDSAFPYRGSREFGNSRCLGGVERRLLRKSGGRSETVSVQQNKHVNVANPDLLPQPCARPAARGRGPEVGKGLRVPWKLSRRGASLWMAGAHGSRHPARGWVHSGQPDLRYPAYLGWGLCVRA